MKIFYTLLLTTLVALQSVAQQYWPHSPTPFPKCNTMPTNCTKVAIGGDWNNANSWSPAGVPTNDQIVCIPAGVTINVQGSTYDASTVCPSPNTTTSPRLQVFICGILNFQPSGKLFLACFSFIQVYSGGRVLAASGSSDLIQVGPNVIWGGPNTGNQGDVTGPWVLSFPFIGAGVLSVGYDYFKASQPQPFEVKLDWGTTSETNSNLFLVERSVDQKSWITIGSVKAIGNSVQKQAYTFVDKTPASGTVFYRLKQVDLKGEIAYSETIRFAASIPKRYSIFPNPVTSTTQIFAKDGFTSAQTIIILDGKGMVVKRINPAGTTRQQLDLSNLSKGLYLVQIIDQARMIEKISLIKQ